MKDRIASMTMAPAQTKVACTVIGAIVFGRIWRRMIIGPLVPAATAAST
jgi:hypothetical protein